jgi:hypothetical protein
MVGHGLGNWRGAWLNFASPQELTGALPAEYPLKPGEKAPRVHRRIGAAYKLDEWALHREVRSFGGGCCPLFPKGWPQRFRVSVQHHGSLLHPYTPHKGAWLYTDEGHPLIRVA